MKMSHWNIQQNICKINFWERTFYYCIWFLPIKSVMAIEMSKVDIFINENMVLQTLRPTSYAMNN